MIINQVGGGNSAADSDGLPQNVEELLSDEKCIGYISHTTAYSSAHIRIEMKDVDITQPETRPTSLGTIKDYQTYNWSSYTKDIEMSDPHNLTMNVGANETLSALDIKIDGCSTTNATNYMYQPGIYLDPPLTFNRVTRFGLSIPIWLKSGHYVIKSDLFMDQTYRPGVTSGVGHKVHEDRVMNNGFIEEFDWDWKSQTCYNYSAEPTYGEEGLLIYSQSWNEQWNKMDFGFTATSISYSE